MARKVGFNCRATQSPACRLFRNNRLRIRHETTTLYRHGHRARREADGESCESTVVECVARAKLC